MGRTDGSRFVVEFPLKTEIYQEHILEKRFEIGRHIYNSLLTVTWKRYSEMIKTKKYRDLQESLKDTTEGTVRKAIYKQLTDMRREYRLSEYDFYADVKEMQHHFKTNLDANTVRSIASNLWKAYEKNIFSNGEEIHYKKRGEMRSLAGKDNRCGIRFLKNEKVMTWNGLRIPVNINEKDIYKMDALERDIVSCRIIRKEIKGKIRYCLQVVLKGKPPVKYNKQTGEVKHPLGKGKVGLNINLTKMNIVKENDATFIELSKNAQDIEEAIKEINRKLDRSRRATNLNNFNEDGTVKKEEGVCLTWNKSNRYKKLQKEKRELQRKQTAIRKYTYECYANDIIACGDVFIINELNASHLQQSGYGKAIGNAAPSMLVSILERKLGYHDIKVNKVKTSSIVKQLDTEYKNVPVEMLRAAINYNLNDDLKTVNGNALNKHVAKLEIATK